MSAAALNDYLATHSYLGSEASVTQYDYTQCTQLKKDGVSAEKFPHLNRWFVHVSHLLETYPKTDFRGDAIPAGKAPELDGKGGKAAAKETEKQPKAAKKEAAPKEAAKKDKGGKDKAAAEKPADKPVDPAAERKAKLKKVVKEGGKRGVEIEGAADMGGLQFFCTSVDEPEGDVELLEESMKAMNAKPIPGEEERKGCSGHIGKTIFSAGTEQLALVAYVPDEKVDVLSCEEWLKATMANWGGEVLSSSKNICTGRVLANSDKGVFPLKIREPMILDANNFLRKKGLFPEDNGSDDDEMVFGDDDFPS
jgi:hypothetical protein